METPITLEWAGSSGMTSLIIIVRSGVKNRTTILVSVYNERNKYIHIDRNVLCM